MIDKTKTRPTAATVEQVEAGAETEQATTSTAKHTTPSSPGQALKVSDFLLHGRENAVPLRYLKGLLHLDGRAVRLMIRAERMNGVPILESSHPLDGGYFLPGDESERARCIQEMRQRAAEITKTADAIEGAANP